MISVEEYRALLRTDFVSFMERAFYELNPQTQLQMAPYIELIAARLEDCRQGRIKRLIINVPPRYLKSHCASISELDGDCPPDHRYGLVGALVLWASIMRPVIPCAIYTRKSSEEGLEQGFNSLDAQREACEAFILSQKTQGWKAIPDSYDDGGFSGGNTERPGLKRLLADISAKKISIVVVYKVDRLTRSLADFAKLVELFDAHEVSFVSVTQQFNTTSSMGRLTLNVLLSFAQFEREVTGERIRDKIAASKRKGLWMGGYVPIGYLQNERTLKVDESQVERIREIFRLYLEFGCVRRLKAELDGRGWVTPIRQTRRESMAGGRPFSRGHLYWILRNPIYIGQIAHKGMVFDGQHPAIVELALWTTVQECLERNRQRYKGRSVVADPSLLAGLAFDGQGLRLAPTHAKKGSRRYRYYVGQAAATTEDAGKALRWPAKPLEDAVLVALSGFLRDEQRLIGLAGSATVDEVRKGFRDAKKMAEQLDASGASGKIELLKHLVDRITIHEQKIEISVRPQILWSPPSTDQHLPILIEVPVALKRRGTAIRLIVRAPGDEVTREPDPKLVALLAKAHDWFERLSSGRCNSIPEIANEEKLDRSYVRRVVYLAFLDPGIVKRIIRGDYPEDLTVTRLVRLAPLPMDWREQRVLLGMSG